MGAVDSLSHEFVSTIPRELVNGHLYISLRFNTAIHLCCCGCGMKVVTPISPTDWSLSYNGESVSLTPSLGNWSFECQSHYWLRRGKIIWAAQLSDSEIRKGREADKATKRAFFEPGHYETDGRERKLRKVGGWWNRIVSWFGVDIG